jgi:CRP-like cAMP-binding protein
MGVHEMVSVIGRFPLFESLSLTDLNRMVSSSEARVVPRHTYVYLADEVGEHVYILVSGSVKIGIFAPDGREIIKRIHQATALFGELCLVGEDRRSEFASSMGQDAVVLAVPLEVFKKMLAANTAFANKLMLLLGDRLRKAERQWESLIVDDVRARIITFLKESADANGRRVGYETLVKHGLTQQDIANLVGASRQTVTAIMNEMKKSNLIHFNRNSILIRDMEKLN